MAEHHHHHHHDDHHEHAQRNKEYWDKHGGAAFERDWIKALYAQISAKVDRCTNWLVPAPTGGPEGSSLLDYACGNGAGTRLLRAHFSRVVGVDIAPRMVEAYLSEFADSASASESAASDMPAVSAVAGTLSTDDPAEAAALADPALFGFDMAVIVMALHHVPDPARTVRDLLARVRPGGHVAVIDWLDSGNAWTPEAEAGAGAAGDAEDGKAVIKTVTKHGFTEEEVRGFFRDGGCVDDAIRVEVNEEVSEVPIRKGNPRFLVARGVRGSSA